LTCKISDHTVTATNVIIVPFKTESFALAAPIDFSTPDNTVVSHTNVLG